MNTIPYDDGEYTAEEMESIIFYEDVFIGRWATAKECDYHQYLANAENRW